MFKQVVEYVEGNGLLHPSHHGSRAKHSTCTAMIEMYDTWIESVEQGEMAGVMMIDLSAAFDLVDHPLLLRKLELMGFDQSAVTWFWSYLTERSQSVYIDGKFSDVAVVDVGVPRRIVKCSGSGLSRWASDKPQILPSGSFGTDENPDGTFQIGGVHKGFRHFEIKIGWGCHHQGGK